MRISDWSSDVCSSDLLNPAPGPVLHLTVKKGSVTARSFVYPDGRPVILIAAVGPGESEAMIQVVGDVKDRKSVVEGKSGAVRVDLGGRRIINKKKIQEERQSMRQR